MVELEGVTTVLKDGSQARNVSKRKIYPHQSTIIGAANPGTTPSNPTFLSPSSSSVTLMAEPLCESPFVGDIDTSAPFESVREAATRFGGFGFWKPSSLSNIFEPSQNDVDEANIVASELEKELISKEGEALKVLKSLESIKAIVEELKSKLHRREDKENCDMSVLKELNQAKTNLCKTTEDLAAIRESVELLNMRLEEERAALEKTRERLNSENAAEISKEIQRLSDDALEFSKTGEEARFAVDKAVCEIERTRSKIKAAEMRLVAARKMKEAARAAEAVAIAEIKDVTRRRRKRETLQEEILEKIEETAQEIRSSRRTIEEGLERVNSAKMEEEEIVQVTQISSCVAQTKDLNIIKRKRLYRLNHRREETVLKLEVQ
ncbi:hypothetical protein YC2023_101998 [Brassica napus]